MGKVGSTSLKACLSQTWPGLTVQTHNILTDIEPVLSRPRRAFEFNQIERKEGVRLVYDKVIRNGGPTFIISPFREPIGRNISAFFQNFERYTGVKHRASTFSIDELIDIFLRTNHHEIPVTWFDEHFKPIFALDVYDYKFPSNGVQAIEHKNTKVLLMQCELPNSTKEAAVREFLNLPSFTLSDSNIGSEKEYAETYRSFREAFIAPDWYIRDMYETRFFTHFYDEIHRHNCIKKWKKI
jgi:hypothetical protein